MVKKVTWSGKATKIFNRILDYYYSRNGNKNYSKKLNRDIKKIISFLKKHPFLGKTTTTLNIRVLISGDYKIIYELTEEEIIILSVWDCRQKLSLIPVKAQGAAREYLIKGIILNMFFGGGIDKALGGH